MSKLFNKKINIVSDYHYQQHQQQGTEDVYVLKEQNLSLKKKLNDQDDKTKR